MTNPVLADRYEIQKQLGQQEGCRTLLARDLRTKNLVVLKLLPFDNDMEWDDLKLFEREAETLKTLLHPSIPRFLDYFETSLRGIKGFVLVQTYTEGISLGGHLQQGRIFTEVETKQIARAILEILVYIHGQQPPVIHRDIRPSNIVLKDGAIGRTSIHLIDFGSVQNFFSQESGSFTVVGTHGYMPPEQFGGRAVIASDLYSLGATLIAILTATHPSSLPQKHLRIEFEQVVQLSPPFATWLQWMTEPRLERRAKSAQEALQALDQGIQHVPAPPSILPKPSDSKVQLTKYAGYLEITLPGLLGQSRLRIDGQEISLTHQKLLGFNQGRSQSARRQDINQVACMKPVAGSQSDSQAGTKLMISAGTQTFELGNNPSLSAAEVDWLASELCNWLKLPLSQ